MNHSRQIVLMIAFSLLTIISVACVPNLPQITIPGLTKPSPTPTKCGCTIEGTPAATPTGGIGAPVGPAAPGSDPTPTSSLAALKDLWPTYTNPGQSFSFEYPAVYDTPQYQFCAARAVKDDPSGASFSLALGSRTELRIFPADGKSLDGAVAEYQTAHSDFTFEPVKNRTAGPEGLPAVTLPYRAGGTNRFGEVTIFLKGDQVFQVNTGTPSACDVPEIGLREWDAYARLLDSIK